MNFGKRFCLELVRVLLNPDIVKFIFFTLGSSGFGFVSFETDDPVERLVGEHFVNLNGKQVYHIYTYTRKVKYLLIFTLLVAI